MEKPSKMKIRKKVVSKGYGKNNMFQKTPFHFPEFFSVEGPMFPLKGPPILDKSVFKVFPEPLHDVEVVALERSVGPDFTDHLRGGRPEVKDEAIGMGTPILKLLKESFCHATVIKSSNGFDIEVSALESISGDLFISLSPLDMNSSRQKGSENWSRLRISGNPYWEARRFFHRSRADLEPVALKLRDNFFSDSS